MSSRLLHVPTRSSRPQFVAALTSLAGAVVLVVLAGCGNSDSGAPPRPAGHTSGDWYVHDGAFDVSLTMVAENTSGHWKSPYQDVVTYDASSAKIVTLNCLPSPEETKYSTGVGAGGVVHFLCGGPGTGGSLADRIDHFDVVSTPGFPDSDYPLK